MARIFLNLVLAAAMAAAVSAATVENRSADGTERIAEAVRKEIATLPFYSVFDNIVFRIDGSTVVLEGEVFRPSLKKSAGRVASRVEGIDRVINNIEILPASTFDDRIRYELAYRLFTNPVLNRYGLQSVPPLHIVVKNGHVSLEGVVLNELEKNVAGAIANGVSGVFNVTNNLRVERL